MLYIKKKFSLFLSYCLPNIIKNVCIKNYELVIKIPYIEVFPLMQILKKNLICNFEILSDIICCDMLKKKIYRFILIYSLLSIKNNIRIRVYFEITDFFKVFSLNSIFKSSNWLEREVWDLFGIFFENHANLKRILNDYTFSWHPLKKDFPLTGYIEVSFNEYLQKITYDEVQLTQEYKELVFNKNWDN